MRWEAIESFRRASRNLSRREDAIDEFFRELDWADELYRIDRALLERRFARLDRIEASVSERSR
jgi:hypothetical protein